MYVILLMGLLNILNVHGDFQTKSHDCSAVTIPMCLEMPYNNTRMPNLLQHRTQEEAAIMAHEFLPLVDIRCSPYVRFFICSVFAPMCTDKVPYGVPSCRSVCTAVRDSCLPLLQNLNFTWPPFLECGYFPEEGLCMMPPDLKRSRLAGITPPTPYTPAAPFNPNWVGGATPIGRGPLILTPKGRTPEEKICSGKRVWVQTDSDHGVCAPLCGEDFLYTAKDKKIAVAWASSWAMVSLLSTSFSLLTFCLNRRRFDYPERPVICLALSYFFYSASFLLRVLLSASTLSCENDPVTGKRHLATSGIASPGCVLTFLLQYYFGIASELWWTTLTFCWFMTSCRFWGSEGLKNFASFFHALAWGVPAVASVVVITLKQVNGEELLGMCFVGMVNPWAQLYLVILPQAVLLTLGTIFIILGFVSLFRIRNAFRREFTCTQNSVSSPSTSLTTIPPSTSPSTTTHSPPTVHLAAHVGKLERLMVRLGVFSVLSTLPAIFILGCRLHAHFKHREWTQKASYISSSCEAGWNKRSCGPQLSHPDIEIDLLRIFMSLIIGVTSGIWVWSRKTILLWKEFLRRLFRFRSSNLFKPVLDNRCGTATNVQPVLDRNVTRGYINLQDNWNPFIRRDLRSNPPRSEEPQLLPELDRHRNYGQGKTHSELTSFV